MSDGKDYYRVMGLSASASDAEIQKAFHHLSLKYHPTKNPGQEDEFKSVARYRFGVYFPPERDTRAWPAGALPLFSLEGPLSFYFSVLTLALFISLFCSRGGGGAPSRPPGTPIPGPSAARANS